MQLAEAEILCVVYDDGVDVGHIDTRLDDGGGQQHVIVVVGEIYDCLLKFAGGHLPVGHQGAGVGHHSLHHLLELVKPLDAVVDDEHLAVASHLEVDGLGQELVGEGAHGGQHRVAVGGRGVDVAEVAGPHERELEGARYGCGRHREGVDRRFHLLEFLLDRHAEFLLLVDDEQPQVLESHILPHYAVGAHDDVDFTLGKVGQNLAHLLRCAGARKVVDPHGEPLQSPGKGAEMLVGQHGGGHQHGHLL